MARRGLLGTLVHQAQVAQRETQRQQASEDREAERAHKVAIREAERDRKARERAQVQNARSAAAEQKQLEKEAREAHIASMEAEAERLNSELDQVNQDLVSLLAATLDVDDYVDLESLRPVVVHPPFDRTDLEAPIPHPDPIEYPPEPTYFPPDAPTGLKSLFGKKKHEKAVADSLADHESRISEWKEQVAKTDAARASAAKHHDQQEVERVAHLASERARYAEESAKREAEVAEGNKGIDVLIANLGYGVPEAVQDYIDIVLSYSVYPDHLFVEHEFKFDGPTAELQLQVTLSSPDTLSTVKAYKYKKASDELTSTELTKKAIKDRYASVVNQVALRTIHEVFEADRRGIIKTISLEVGTHTIVPATGLQAFIPFVAVGAEREAFIALNLANVLPSATLNHLGATISKNPSGLVAIDGSGVRRS